MILFTFFLQRPQGKPEKILSGEEAARTSLESIPAYVEAVKKNLSPYDLPALRGGSDRPKAVKCQGPDGRGRTGVGPKKAHSGRKYEIRRPARNTWSLGVHMSATEFSNLEARTIPIR
jgi:hypothetical protein